MGTETTRALLAAGAIVSCLAGALGCQSVAKLETRQADPPPPRDQCILPTVGDAKLRVANLVPSEANVDFCIRPTGSASYGYPILRSAGTDPACADGLGYKQMTVPFATPSGTIDVKVVPAGAGGCGQPAIAELSGVAVPASAVTQILNLGGAADAPRIVALREGVATTGFKFRFVNALSGFGPLGFGLTYGARVPTTMSVDLVPDPVPFGAAIPPSAKVVIGSTIDDLSYLNMQVAGTTFGAHRVGDGKAIFAYNPGDIRGGKFSLFAVGHPTDVRYPPRALFCDETVTSGSSTGGILLDCAESDLPSLSFEVYGVALYGLYAKYEAERRAALPAAIAQNTADVMCLHDVWSDTDKQTFIAAAQDEASKQRGTGFAYSATFPTNRDTPIDDPRKLDGTMPDLPAPAPACGQNADQANKLISCLETQCNTSPASDDSGGLTTSECVTAKCLSSVVPLATGNAQQQGCFACVVFDMIAHETYGFAKSDCYDPAGAQGYFRDENGMLILSKFPLSDVQGYVLPTVGQRRVVVSARATYEAGKTIDVHCGVTDSILSSPFNYNGPYSDAHDQQGYMDEQHLQALRIIDHVRQYSAQGPALIGLGVFASAADPRNPKFVDTNPIVPQLLGQAFTSAEAPGYTPLCTVCGDQNPIDDPSAYAWYTRSYVFNMDPARVVSSSRGYTDPVVQAAGTAGVPLSENFSYRVEVLRP